MMGKLKKLTGYRLFLPLSCLIIVLLINLITTCLLYTSDAADE